MSLPAKIAFFSYLLVAIAAFVAAWHAKARHNRANHGGNWVAIFLAFIGLASVRIFDWEQAMRESLRTALRSAMDYGDRANLQAPLVVVVLLVAVAAALLARRYWRNTPSVRERYLRIAQFATLAFVPLFALRLISLHVVDTLLYAAPFKLNWVVDGLLTGVVGLSAALYIRRVQRSSGGISQA